MTPKEKISYLHALEKKLNSFRKRTPLYCQCVVLFDEDLICVTVPGILGTTMKIPVDFSIDVSDHVRLVHDTLQPYFPVISKGGKEFYIDKVDFHSNSFVVKYEGCPADWASFYKMKRPVSLILKEFLQSKTLTPEEKGKIFESNIKENTSEEDYRDVL